MLFLLLTWYSGYVLALRSTPQHRSKLIRQVNHVTLTKCHKMPSGASINNWFHHAYINPLCPNNSTNRNVGIIPVDSVAMTSEDQKTRQKRTLLMLTGVITSGVLVATSEIIYTEISEYLQMLWSYKMEHGISFIGILSVFPTISLDDNIMCGCYAYFFINILSSPSSKIVMVHHA